MADNETAAASNGDEAAGPQVGVQKIYVRDGSVEVPNGPRIFTQELQPELNVDLNSRAQQVEGDNFEVTLTVTLTAKQDEQTAYIVEVQQAGVFQVHGFADAQRGHVLGAYCPSVLFPYVRESVSDLVQRAGFPPFLLQPVNFDALYQEQVRRARQQQAESAH